MSDYNKAYLNRIKESLDFYADIYDLVLDRMAEAVSKPLSEVTMVDYGGGHGLLSMMAKERGVGQVIYIDSNVKSVETMMVLSDLFEIGPDVVLHGDSRTLVQWCRREEEQIDALAGMDVIEHIYCLDDFFADVVALGERVEMIFTTGSTPYNPRVARRLHAVMEADERNYADLRRDYLTDQYPEMLEKDLDYWVANTRGLVYEDIRRAVESKSPNMLTDAYNTCDPRNGNWTERILPLEDYEQILSQYGYEMCYELGFHNTHRKGWKALASWLSNAFLSWPGGRSRAPWLILFMSKK